MHTLGDFTKAGGFINARVVSSITLTCVGTNSIDTHLSTLMNFLLTLINICNLVSNNTTNSDEH